jgi:HSP20 family molecular chaperone IbpA
MFSKKICKKCGEKLNKKYSFCPICGTPLNKRIQDDDFGMLGRNDFFENSDALSTSLFGGLSGGIMNKMFNNAMKMLEKELQQNMKNQNNPNMNNLNNMPRTKFRLMINGKEINLNDGTIAGTGIQKKDSLKDTSKKAKTNEFTEEQNEKFSKLKKIMPKSHLKRIDDKIIYEIELPGVESLKETSIIKLEDGIEIKALAEKKAYLKRVPLTLPILNYSLSENMLILEFKGN